jgi:hypothetical protein
MKTDHIHCLGSAAAAAEVRSSADQCVRSHRSTKCSRLCSAFERSNVSLHCVHGTGARARTQRCVRLSTGMRALWNGRQYVRSPKMRSTALSAPDFPETQTEINK